MNIRHLLYQQSAPHTEALLRSRGIKRITSTRLIEAALSVANDRADEREVDMTKQFFSTRAVIVPRGLDAIPKIWLSQLPRILWQSRKPHWRHLPYMISSVTCADGLLCLAFAQEQPEFSGRVSAWDRVRVLVNRQLSPNIFTPLSVEIERRIWQQFPELRSELFQL